MARKINDQIETKHENNTGAHITAKMQLQKTENAIVFSSLIAFFVLPSGSPAFQSSFRFVSIAPHSRLKTATVPRRAAIYSTR